MYRVLRVSELLENDCMRFCLRAVPVKQDGAGGHEVAVEVVVSELRERIAMRQTIATPEQTFEQLWQQLRVDLDVTYG